MNYAAYLQAALALLFVLGLFGLGAMLARRFGLAPKVLADRGHRRLAVVESVAPDARHRLVLLRRDGVEHLVILGPSADVVVERAIASIVPAVVGEADHAG
ncbi:MAG: flagellar biosynthetic protein FliO [Rhodospirillales bacterium]